MASHTNTGEWQSFEVRMRQKRAARLALRAEVAAMAGCPEDAEKCLAEARMLAPGLPEIRSAEAAIAAAVAAPPLPAEEAAATPETPEVLPLPTHSSRTIGYSAAAVLAVLVLLALVAWPRNTPEELVASEAPAAEPVRNEPAPAPLSNPEPAAPAADPAPPITTHAEPAPRVSAPQPDAVPARGERGVPEPIVTGTSGPGRSPDTVSIAATREEPVLPAPLPVSTLPSVVSNPPPSAPPAAPSLDVATPNVMTPNVAAPAPVSVEPSQDALVRAVLNRYAAAYSDLDVDAAARVWPSVNRGALGRAFDSLSEQRVSLGECRIDVTGTTAQARCAGSATWTPKVGAGSHTETRSWTFQLARGAGSWQIVSARVQNK